MAISSRSGAETDYREELERRIIQFTYYLNLMVERRSRLTKGNCFVIFEEQHDWEWGNTTKAQAAPKPLVAAFDIVAWQEGGYSIALNDNIDLPDEGWRGDDSQRRFIQFSFNPKYFDIDLPNTTLYRPEAEQVLRHRSGFFYVKELRQFEHPSEKADEFNPLRKVYIHSDARTAAEDMAFVWFCVWKFPVDWTFYVTARSFHDLKNWEDGKPLPVDWTPSRLRESGP